MVGDVGVGNVPPSLTLLTCPEAVNRADDIFSEIVTLGFSKGGKGPGWAVPGWLGGKAAGGPVSANTPYIVGERGPEIFWPSNSGQIIPSGSGGSRSAGSSGPTYITLVLDRQVLAQVTLDELQRYGSRNVTMGLN